MKKNKAERELLGIITVVSWVIIALVTYEVFVWKECLHDHSVLYCMRVLS